MLQILQRHSEAEPKNPLKSTLKDWILRFAYAALRMTIPIPTLVLISEQSVNREQQRLTAALAEQIAIGR